MKRDVKYVIDADNQVKLEEFDKSDTEKVKSKYEAMGRWDDISIDREGNIILWEDE